MRRLWQASLLLLILTHAAACGVGVPDLDKAVFACRSHEDCADDYKCVYGDMETTGHCVASSDPCLSDPSSCVVGGGCDTRGDPPCSDNSICIEGKCGNGEYCVIDCPAGGELCWATGECRPNTCVSNSDCPNGFGLICDPGAHKCVTTLGTTNPWYELGGSARDGLPGTNNASSIDLAVTHEGHPTVAITRGDASASDILVIKWNGSTWTTIGDNGSMVAAHPHDVSVAIDNSNSVVTAWQEANTTTYTSAIYLRRYNGSSWQSLDDAAPGVVKSGMGQGLSVSPDSISMGPDVAIDGSYIYAAWRESVTATPAVGFLRRWTGATWESLGGSTSSGNLTPTAGAIDDLALAAGGGVVLVGWSSGMTISGTRWPSGGPWTFLPKRNVTDITEPVVVSATLDASRQPILAYDYYDGSLSTFRASVAQQPVGDHSTGYWSNVSSRSGRAPSLCASDDDAGRGLAYVSAGTTPGNIHVQQAAGTGWQGLDGSDQNNGVSFPEGSVSLTPAVLPAIATGGTTPRRMCVAFYAAGAVRVRCHDLP